MKIHTLTRLREEYSISRGLKKSGRMRLVRKRRRFVSASSASSTETYNLLTCYLLTMLTV